MMRYLILMLFSGFTSGQPLLWLYPDEPPQSYRSQQQPAGYTFAILELLLQPLQQYQHQTIPTGNYARLFKELEKDQPACALGIIHTPERAQTLLFSQRPVFLFFNVQVVMHNSLYQQLHQPPTIALTELLRQRYKVGISAGRRYTAELEHLLHPYRDHQLLQLAQGNVHSSLLQLINLERLDYTLEYPEMLFYIRQQQPELVANLTSIPIKETDAFGVSWLACNDTELTREIMPLLNQQLASIRSLPAYYQLLAQRQLPQQLHMFEQHYQQVFLTTRLHDHDD
jgi:uncharacterized protein (TIGR02285 family)